MSAAVARAVMQMSSPNAAAPPTLRWTCCLSKQRLPCPVSQRGSDALLRLVNAPHPRTSVSSGSRHALPMRCLPGIYRMVRSLRCYENASQSCGTRGCRVRRRCCGVARTCRR